MESNVKCILKHKEMQYLESIYQITFQLGQENISLIVKSIMKYFDQDNLYSFNTVLCQCVYSSFYSQRKSIDIYFLYLQSIEESEKQILQQNPQIFNVFLQFLLLINKNESNYIIAQMIENNFIKPDLIQDRLNIKSYYANMYFAHIIPKDFEEELNSYFSTLGEKYINIEELKKDNWKLHHHFIKEGNPSEMSKIIRNDEVEKLQEMSSQSIFDYGGLIQSSPYEKYSFLKYSNVTLIDYAAFFGSINCFKFLLLNGSKLTNTIKYAIAGGNIEIIHLCEQYHSTFEGSLEIAIEFHRNEIFHYLYDNNISKEEKTKIITKLGIKCIESGNYEIFSFLEQEGLSFNDEIIQTTMKSGNLYLVKHITKEKDFPKNSLPFSVSSKNIELVRYVIQQKGIDVNSKDDKNYASLIYASEFGLNEIAKLLLEYKEIDVNVRDTFYKKTALIFASEKGYKEIVKLLLEQKRIDINAKDRHGKTAFMYANEKGHIEVVELLLKQDGIDVNAREFYNGQTGLMYACENGYIGIIKLLLEYKGIDINVKNWGGDTALMKISRKSNTEVVKMLLEKSDFNINEINNERFSALMIASEYNQIEVAKLLLEKEGIDINIKNNNRETAFIIASHKCHIEIVKLLLEQKGIDINIKNSLGKSALILATKNGYFEIIKLILEYKSNEINKNDCETALIIATQNNYTEIVKLLLKQEGININHKDNYGMTPLLIASQRGFTDIVKLLLEKETLDINAKNNQNQTALLTASTHGNIEIVKLLLERKGIDINAKDVFGRTALIEVSWAGRTEIVKLLLEQEEIDMNVKTRNGMTPILLAAARNKTEIVEIFKNKKGVEYDEQRLKEVSMSPESVMKGFTPTNLDN